MQAFSDGVKHTAMMGEEQNLFLHHFIQVRSTSAGANLGSCHPTSSVCSIPFFLLICNDSACWAGAIGQSQISVLLFCALMIQSSFHGWQWKYAVFKACGFALWPSFFPCQVVAICSRVAFNIECSASWTIKTMLCLSHKSWLWNCPWQVAMGILLVQ